MPYRFKRKERVSAGVRRIAGEQLEKAIAELNDPGLDRHEAVHQVRKRCKKLRGLLRLVRPDNESLYQRENAFFRDAARPLSYLRDAQSLIECYDALLGHCKSQVVQEEFHPLRDWLMDRRQRIADDEVDFDARLLQFTDQVCNARSRAEQWKIKGKGFDAVAAGLHKTYQRAKTRMDQAHDQPSTESFHQWRKRVKYHWYHARLLRDIWKGPMKAHADAASDLADLLGDDHDLAVLRETLVEHIDELPLSNEAMQAFFGLVDCRQHELRVRAHPLGCRLLAEKPKRLIQRWGAYWKAWRSKARAKPQPAAEAALAAK